MKVLINESQLKLLIEGLEFSEVYKKTFPRIFNSVCMRFAKGDYDLAQEYCQTGFIRVYQKLDTFKGDSSIDTWVSRVVTNEIINVIRPKVKTVTPDKDIDVEKLNIVEPETKKEDEIEYMGGKYTPEMIKRAIEKLPDGYKFVFYNYFYNNKSHQEIADALGINSGTSRSQLSKAKRLIKNYLEKNG